MWFCLHFLFYFVITIFLLLQTPTNFCWMTFTCVSLSTLPLIGLTSVLLPPCRSSLIVPRTFFWCQIVLWKNLQFLFSLWSTFVYGFLVFSHFVLLSLWLDSPLMHPALIFQAVTSVLPQKPSLTIICVIPAIIRVAPPDRQAVPLLSHRLRFGRLPWHGLWKMEELK